MLKVFRPRTVPPSSGSVRSTWIGALLCLALANSCAEDSGFDSSSAPGALTLGDIEYEHEFFVTNGAGTITVVNDTSIGDIACAHFGSGNGHFVIKINPTIMNLVSQPTQDFFLLHEFGHIYLKHLFQSNPNYREREHFADAYGIRLLAVMHDSEYADQAIYYFEASNSPPDDTHPSYEARAWYQHLVLDAYNANPTQVPAPPATLGALMVLNSQALPVNVYANDALLGNLHSGQSESFQVFGDPFWGDSYHIELRDFFTGTLLLQGEATVFAPGTTAWPSTLFSNDTLPDTGPTIGVRLGPAWDSFVPEPAPTSGWNASTLPSPVELLMFRSQEMGPCGTAVPQSSR